MILNLGQLLEPIPGASVAGTNLRSDLGGTDIYYRMKDARSTARAAERAADADVEQASRPAEWRLLLDMAQDALARQTKDLEIAAWLTEAALRLHGFAGLRDGFALMDGLVERYWDDLFSVDTETIADKVAPLVGLNGDGGDGTLIQPIRLAPLTNPVDGAGLWHFMKARRGGAKADAVQQQVESAVRATDATTFAAVAHDVRDALARFEALCDRLERVCGLDAPPSANIRNTLTEAMDVVVELAGPALVDRPVSSSLEQKATAVPGAVVSPAQVAIHDREEALGQLSQIAAFFKNAEPNAPTGYVLETLVRRARLPWAELVRELLTDETARQTLLTVAGIGVSKTVA